VRFWQKIFLISLLLATIAISVISSVLLVRSHETILRSTKEATERAFESYVATVGKRVAEEKAKTHALFLTRKQVATLLSDMADNSRNEEVTLEMIADVSDNYSMWGLSGEQKIHSVELKDMSDKKLIRVTSTVLIEGKPYTLSASKDVTAICSSFQSDIAYVQSIGGIVSVAIAGILLWVMIITMRPLGKINAVTKKIAEGNYRERIPVSGNDELSELADNMNVMANKIEENVSQMERLAESRRVFIANMTHELKTPLTSILGFANVLKIKADVLDEERREYASIIEAEAKRLRLLSNKLSELILLGENKLDLQQENIQAVISEISERIAPLLETRQLCLNCEVQPLCIMMDKTLFVSLIYNLLDNAMKASSPGQSVHVTANDDSGHAIITVQDYGSGIPKDKIPQVTEAFFMVDKARSRKAGGFGMGLALCKAIAGVHHGTLDIQSKEGHGTCVVLKFPIVKEERSE